MLHFKNEVVKLGVCVMQKKITLSCEKCLSRNYQVPKTKNTERFEIKKFCKTCNEHTNHRETK